MSATAIGTPLRSHPGLDPGSMNTVLGEPASAVFMGPGLRRDDSVGAQT
jgi:hypothetical protein